MSRVHGVFVDFQSYKDTLLSEFSYKNTSSGDGPNVSYVPHVSQPGISRNQLLVPGERPLKNAKSDSALIDQAMLDERLLFAFERSEPRYKDVQSALRGGASATVFVSVVERTRRPEHVEAAEDSSGLTPVASEKAKEGPMR